MKRTQWRFGSVLTCVRPLNDWLREERAQDVVRGWSPTLRLIGDAPIISLPLENLLLQLPVFVFITLLEPLFGDDASDLLLTEVAAITHIVGDEADELLLPQYRAQQFLDAILLETAVSGETIDLRRQPPMNAVVLSSIRPSAQIALRAVDQHSLGMGDLRGSRAST